jgi:two-component system sensor histidine kinase KdpD
MQRSSFLGEFFLRYIPSILSIALATFLLTWLRQSLSTPIVALLYLLPVGLSASLWGLGAGIVAALAAFLAFNYFFIEPHFTLTVHSPSDLVVVLVFLVVAVAISQLVGRARLGQALATTREFEAIQLYELSAALTGLPDQQSILHAVADQIQKALVPEALQINVDGSLAVLRPGSVPPRNAELSVPFQNGTQTAGTINLWRNSAFTQSEQRLVLTVASQTGLALERVRLAQSESRARVLEESDKLKSALLSSVSHELRTPLATIKAAATSLRSGEVGWESNARQNLLEAVEDEADHLNLLVGNLLNMSRIEANQLKPILQWNQLSEIVSAVIKRITHTRAEHQIVVEIPEDFPFVPVDFLQMEQVFTNLLNNSFRYAPAGTAIRILARTEKESQALIRVENQGPPVDEQHLAGIFEKFHRISASDTVTGTGLGLSICKGIIEAHGGQIWAENLPAGFAIDFTIPLTMDGKLAAQPPAEVEL